MVIKKSGSGINSMDKGTSTRVQGLSFVGSTSELSALMHYETYKLMPYIRPGAWCTTQLQGASLPESFLAAGGTDTKPHWPDVADGEASSDNTEGGVY